MWWIVLITAEAAHYARCNGDSNMVSDMHLLLLVANVMQFMVIVVCLIFDNAVISVVALAIMVTVIAFIASLRVVVPLSSLKDV